MQTNQALIPTDDERPFPITLNYMPYKEPFDSGALSIVNGVIVINSG